MAAVIFLTNRKEKKVMIKKDVEWKEFFLEDVVTIGNGVRLTKSDMEDGDTPFIGASEMNNGITAYCSNRNGSYDNNLLGVNYNGSVGFSFYHPYYALFSDDVKRVKWKDTSKNCKYTLLFLAVSIQAQKDKYAYGYKFNSQRMKRQKILLPINDKMEPDFAFMEAYMRAKEQEILKPTIKKLCKHLIINKIGGCKSLDSNWKVFFFTDVFTEIQRGRRLKKADHTDGSTPYVSSTSFNNGIDGFIDNKSSVRIFENCLTIANSGSVGSAFFHKYKFIASDHVTKLKRDGLDKYAYLFLVPLISRLNEKYSFNREINNDRIKREKFILPVNQQGEIDFEFMSYFMQKVEQDILKTTLPIYEMKLKLV